MADKLARLQAEARQAGKPIPARLPPDTALFEVPDKLCKILNRDLRLAGIPKRDDRGRVLDVHALRHTFGTMLSVAGVSPRVTMELMRHSNIRLTMRTYTDAAQLPLVSALAQIPTFKLSVPTTFKSVRP